MKFKLLLLLIATPTWLMAAGKSTVKLTGEDSHEIRGGVRSETVKISNEWMIPTEDKMQALEQRLTFYKLMQAKKIDLSKPITAVYKEKPLSEVFKEILPNVEIEFGDVDPNVTVGSMEVSKAPLGKFLEYLDDSAGVFFIFSEKGVLVSSKPQLPKDTKP